MMDLHKREGIVSQRYLSKTQLDLLECNLLKQDRNDKFTKSLIEKLLG